MAWYDYRFRPYVPVAKRRANAAREMAKLAKKGHVVSPVNIKGRTIAATFWGKAWCEHLESYSDFANRLPRGRTYVRNGSVVDLQIKPGRVTAHVSGSELYEIDINIKPLAQSRWASIRSECAGKIASVLELLRGRLSKGVMEIITHRETGLFPEPSEITLNCSCPDWADMCKHIAAVLYGVGARLDEKPELLFVLRQVDHLDLIEQAAAGLTPADASVNASATKTIAETDLADVFGIDLDANTTDTTQIPANTKGTATIATPPPPPSTRNAAAKGTAKNAARTAANTKSSTTGSRKTTRTRSKKPASKTAKTAISKTTASNPTASVHKTRVEKQPATKRKPARKSTTSKLTSTRSRER